MADTREQLYEALDATGPLRDVARMLGRYCLYKRGRLLLPRGQQPTAEQARSELASDVAGSGIRHDTPDFGPQLSEWLRQHHHDRLGLLDIAPGFGAHGTLRGLCQGPLTLWFERDTSKLVDVHFGDPIPGLERKIESPEARVGLTPRLASVLEGSLLGEELYFLYDQGGPSTDGDDGGLRVFLDSSRRDDLDKCIWDTAAFQFQLMCTVHPHESDAIDPRRIYVDPAGWWFGVKPEGLDEDAVKRSLKAARDAGAAVAVLPEMSLPAARMFEEHIANHPDEVPDLIVAGSAHEWDGPPQEGPHEGERANRVVVYIKGAKLFEHCKVWPFWSKDVGAASLHDRLPEGVNTPPILIVANGRTTRMAVVICSDLHDERGVLAAIRGLGVNLLLVPTLTPSEGMFEGVVAHIAASRQGIALMANGSFPGAGNEPHLVLIGVPREGGSNLMATWKPGPDDSRRVAVLIDPNQPASNAVVAHAALGAPLDP